MKANLTTLEASKAGTVELADAIYGLASTLAEAGRRYEARHYWRQYLRCVPEGESADFARSQLPPA